jgi:tRNA threonylcarbamoyladenosine biosynthesis protein TsaE
VNFEAYGHGVCSLSLDSQKNCPLRGPRQSDKSFCRFGAKTAKKNVSNIPSMHYSLSHKKLESLLLKGISCLSLEETHHLSAEFALALPKDKVVYFHGDLGSGKTSFIQGMAKTYGISASVTSPTFNLWHHYKGSVNLFHLDAYRLRSPEEADHLYLEDFLVSPYVICVEWPEKLLNGCLKPHFHLWFSQKKEDFDERIIRLSQENFVLDSQ